MVTCWHIKIPGESRKCYCGGKYAVSLPLEIACEIVKDAVDAMCRKCVHRVDPLDILDNIEL